MSPVVMGCGPSELGETVGDGADEKRAFENDRNESTYSLPNQRSAIGVRKAKAAGQGSCLHTFASGVIDMRDGNGLEGQQRTLPCATSGCTALCSSLNRWFCWGTASKGALRFRRCSACCHCRRHAARKTRRYEVQQAAFDHQGVVSTLGAIV